MSIRSSGIVERDDDARAERRRRGAHAFEREWHIELVGPHEESRGAAEEHGLELALHAACEREHSDRALRQTGLRTRRAFPTAPGEHRRASTPSTFPPAPIAANAGPPSRMIRGMLASVSTLLINVGFLKTPDSTGKGGLFLGSPRWPSIELNTAVSSPQIYAPPPILSSNLRSPIKPCAVA